MQTRSACASKRFPVQQKNRTRLPVSHSQMSEPRAKQHVTWENHWTGAFSDTSAADLIATEHI